MAQHCCEMMRSNVENGCVQHPDRFECPDALVNYSELSGAYGLIVHDGGSSFIEIAFCPWCGAKLADG